jgi:NAD(P)-dependent dehydrogenase (short-subunit alcohol dehydrogenase family)
LFEHKRALVVGGTSGIGLETARRLAGEGADVFVVGRERDRLDVAVREVSDVVGKGASVLGEAADAADDERMREVFGRVEGEWGGLDVLVHVAGISGRRFGDGPVDECTEEGWDIVMRNNARSAYLSNRYAAGIMKRQRGGSIVNVSSVLGLAGAREHFVTHAYAASRGAVISLSRAMAAYYSRFNVRVNCVCPGLLDTPMSQRAINSPDIREALTTLQPLEPHVGYPDDVAEAILYLAGDGAKFVTGIALPVDGGWTAQ